MPDAVRMSFWRHSWPLKPDMCPCDVDFCDLVEERRIGGRAVFHFGTGEHHLVGRRNAELRPPNHILGVTASEAEYGAYIRYVIDNPRAANHYKVVFLDIYTLSREILPDFDLVTLFHLCEFYRAGTSAYAPLDDRGVLDLFISKLRPGGRILFYRGSSAAEKMRAIVDGCVGEGRLVPAETYRSLLVYGLP